VRSGERSVTPNGSMVFSFMDYMATLPAAKMDQLYDSAWTCQAVLRSLPPLAKQYAARPPLCRHGACSDSLES
jgi:transcription initiation factor TFIIH subunit 4